MRDGPGRRTVKALARARYAFDLRLTRALRRRRGERPYLLGGSCRRCARCCEAPGIQTGRLLWHWPLLRRGFLWWQRAVNGFELTGRDEAARVFVFRCTHFDPATRSCDSYESRPGLCRDYPRTLLWQPQPEMLPGCGYRPVVWNARGLTRALEGANLSPEQREKLQKGLFLEPSSSSIHSGGTAGRDTDPAPRPPGPASFDSGPAAPLRGSPVPAGGTAGPDTNPAPRPPGPPKAMS